MSDSKYKATLVFLFRMGLIGLTVYLLVQGASEWAIVSLMGALAPKKQ